MRSVRSIHRARPPPRPPNERKNVRVGGNTMFTGFEARSSREGIRVVHQERPASPLAIAVFGAFDVRLHGRPLPPPRSQRTHWLLALLALQDGGALERTWP